MLHLNEAYLGIPLTEIVQDRAYIITMDGSFRPWRTISIFVTEGLDYSEFSYMDDFNAFFHPCHYGAQFYICLLLRTLTERFELKHMRNT